MLWELQAVVPCSGGREGSIEAKPLKCGRPTRGLHNASKGIDPDLKHELQFIKDYAKSQAEVYCTNFLVLRKLLC